MLVIRTGIHKMLVEIANREDPNQTAHFLLGLKFSFHLHLPEVAVTVTANSTLELYMDALFRACVTVFISSTML